MWNSFAVAAKIPVIVLSDSISREDIRKCGTLCAYYVKKSDQNWRRIQPIIYELIDIDPPVVETTGEVCRGDEA